MAISMLKIRRPLGRLIFNMGIDIPGKTVFLIETAPWYFYIRNRKNTVEIQWVKSVEYVWIYNAIDSEQPAAKVNLYPLPVVLLASHVR